MTALPAKFLASLTGTHQAIITPVMENAQWLSSAIADFEASLDLFQESTDKAYSIRPKPPSTLAEMETFKAVQRERDRFANRRIIAARNAALVISEFCQAAEAIIEELNKVPEALGAVDSKHLAHAEEAFQRGFPEYIAVRHGVAHSIDKGLGAKEAKRHTVQDQEVARQFNTIGGSRISQRRGKFGLGDAATGVLVQFALDDDHFQTSWRGKMVSFDINAATLEKMLTVQRSIFDAMCS